MFSFVGSFAYEGLSYFVLFVLVIQALPSPTTGGFTSQTFDWRSNSNGNKKEIEEEDNFFSDFSFQPQTGSVSTTSSFNFQSSSNTVSVVWFLF